MRGTKEQLKAKGLYLCFVLNLRISGDSCLIFNWHGSRAAPGVSFFRVPTTNGGDSINWRNNIIAVIIRDTVMKQI